MFIDPLFYPLAAAAGAPQKMRRVTFQLWGVAQARPRSLSPAPTVAAAGLFDATEGRASASSPPSWLPSSPPAAWLPPSWRLPSWPPSSAQPSPPTWRWSSLSSSLVSSLKLPHLFDEALNGRDRFLEQGLFSLAELDLDHSLHASGAEHVRHADIATLVPVLSLDIARPSHRALRVHTT